MKQIISMFNSRPNLNRLLDDPTTPKWIREVAQIISEKGIDKVDACNGLEALVQAMDKDVEELVKTLKTGRKI